MNIFSYSFRTAMMLLVAMLGLRIIGKKSISQITTYDLAAIFLMTNIAAEPLVYKIPSKATLGILLVSILTVIIGKLSLSRKFYNIDSAPSIVIHKGKIVKKALKNNHMNVPILISQLRINGFDINDVEYAIIEPEGNISVTPKHSAKMVTKKDLNIASENQGLLLPLIIDGEIIYQNLKYRKLDNIWLTHELEKRGILNTNNIILAEIDENNKIYIYQDNFDNNISTPFI